MKKLILILIVITALIAGCKKYPDGPLISFRTAKGRLYGYHTLTKYTVNGVDSLSRYQDSLCTNFHFYYNEDDGNNYCSMAGRNSFDNYISEFYWIWELEDNNKVLKVTTVGENPPRYGGTGPFKNNVLPEWKILKLKASDIIMTTTYNGNEYLIELTK